MRSTFKFILFFTLIVTYQSVVAQRVDLDYFVSNALKNDPGIKQNVNQQQIYSLQSQLINAQNKAPQVSFTSDYLFVPTFGGGKVVSVTPNPPDGAFGYDPALTNGGL